MTSTVMRDPDADRYVPVGTTVMRYPNQNGAIVEVFAANYPLGTASGSVSPSRDRNRAARCHGCDQARGTIERGDLIDAARSWAVKHSAECRALPQQDEPTGPDFRALAHQYAQRTVWLIEGRAPEDGSSATVDAQESPLRAAETYAGLAGVYAMLATT